MRHLIVTALFLLLVGVNACAAPVEDTGGSDFANRIHAIDEKLERWSSGTLFYYEFLLQMPEFETMVEHAGENVDICLNYLSETTHSQSERTIAIYSMHQAPLEAWVRFVNGVLDLHDAKRISARDVMNAVLPIEGFSQRVIDDFLRPDIRAILYRARNIQELSATEKSGLTTIMFGFAAFIKWLVGPNPHK